MCTSSYHCYGWLNCVIWLIAFPLLHSNAFPIVQSPSPSHCCGIISPFPASVHPTTSSSFSSRCFLNRHLPQKNYYHAIGFCGKIRCAVTPTPYFAESSNSNNQNSNGSSNNESVTTAAIASGNTITTSPPQSLFQWIDDMAQQLKPAAIRANEEATILKTKSVLKYRYFLQSYIFYCLFLCYRAYRGFFVILPAVFQATFMKLQSAVDDTPFDTTPASTGMKLRTRITISFVTSLIILSYVVSGAGRVLWTLIRSTMNGSNVFQSLQSALQMYEQNESILYQKSTTPSSISNETSSASTTVIQSTLFGSSVPQVNGSIDDGARNNDGNVGLAP
jgi:hypothetical protein